LVLRWKADRARLSSNAGRPTCRANGVAARSFKRFRRLFDFKMEGLRPRRRRNRSGKRINWDDNLIFGAVRWRLVEYSLVSTPADPAATIGSRGGYDRQIVADARGHASPTPNARSHAEPKKTFSTLSIAVMKRYWIRSLICMDWSAFDTPSRFSPATPVACAREANSCQAEL
jgi:hypothetical protein